MANLDLNFNQNDYDIVKLSDPVDATFPTEGTYVRLSIFDEESNNLPEGIGAQVFYSTLSSTPVNVQIPSNVSDISQRTLTQTDSDFVLYQNTTDEENPIIYIKPNEILNSAELPQGNYTLSFEFLKQYQPTTQTNLTDYFIVKEISPSRLEVRLKLLDNNITADGLVSQIGNNWLNDFKTTLGSVDSEGEYTHGFKHVLYTGAFNIPILNVTFDDIRDGGNNQSVILKLYERLPSSVNNLQIVTIEEELLISQTQDIVYFSDVVPGDSLYSLSIDNEFDYGYTDLETQVFQNLDEITGSLSQDVLSDITTGSYFEYKNLNPDFNFFSNHVVFGSAKRKIENFKNKVETIQSYYSDISSSLSFVGVSSASDDASVVKLRKNLFTKIRDELKTFTPYEKFLYYDVQSTSTASAPGIKNYAHLTAVSMSVNDSVLNRHDGFDVVYKHNSPAGNTDSINYFKDVYHAHKKPFFNYSSSIYLSFLIKGGGNETHAAGLKWDNSNGSPGKNGLSDGIILPTGSHYQESTLTPIITGSEYRRFIYHTSMSYFQPNESVDFDLGNKNFTADENQITILSGSIKTGSFAIQDSSGDYNNLLTVITESGVTFNGSVMPAGELFRISLPATITSNATSSLITDVKVTLQNPADILPFDNLYHTSSTKWQSWYDGTYASASAFDENNIHSLENNLPDYIQKSSQYDDLKKFLSIIGEQTDLIRNYVDNFDTFNKRNYDKIESVPGNLLPILIENMGWDPIQPFTSSLANYYGGLLSSNTSIKNVEENTWRKTLNNLLYLYKSKGTKNAIRALLNIYGYPPDVLSINEFGGSTQPQNDNPISPLTPLMGTTNNDTNLSQATGNVSFYLKPKKLYHYRFNNKLERVLKTDWWMNNANANTIEFIYKHRNSSNNQTLFKSSGSGNETLWDLRLLPSSDGLSSSFQFRINNSLTGSLAIASNALSMSTNFLTMTNGQLWNVMLQRMTSSISGSGTNRYQLVAATQKGSSIHRLSFTSMSISGGLNPDSNYRANQNWQSSGSRHPLSSSNLFIGNINFTGSLAELRTWNTALSMSKFRLHTLNKFSTVGNNIDAHTDDLIYHFRLNENYNSSSISSSAQTKIDIIDSNPNGPSLNPTDYSFKMSSSITTGSTLYGFDIIELNSISLQDSTQNLINDNKIVIKPDISFNSNLNAFKSSTTGLVQHNSKAKRINSVKLEINTSPQDFVNNFILEKIQGFNLEKKYANPQNMYSSSHEELEDFRKNFFTKYEVSVDTNKFIRSQESIYNKSIIDGIKKIVPARSTLADRNHNVGVTIKPTILEKQKIKYQTNSVEVNPNLVSGSIDVPSTSSYKSGFNLSNELIQPKSGSLSVVNTISQSYSIQKPLSSSLNIPNTITKTFTIDKPKSGSISIVNEVSESIEIQTPFSSSLSIVNQISKSFSLDLPKSGSVSVVNTISKSFGVQLPKSASISINNQISKSFNLILPKSASISINNAISKSFSIDTPKSASLTIVNTYVSTSANIELPISGTNNYINTNYTNKFVNLHDSWGTSSSDIHFLNMAALNRDTSSVGNYNVNHVERRNHFYMIGDIEIYSGSRTDKSDFSNFKNFHNRKNITEFVHGNVTYESYINGNPGAQTGRAIGKTRYFFTSSDGTIVLPSNHVRRFSNPFVDRMYQGTQNPRSSSLGPGFMMKADYDDLSTASFYRVKVTGGENKLIVKNTNPEKEGRNKIM